MSILEQCLAFDNELTVNNINQVYGLLSNESKIKLIKLLLNKDMKGVLNTLDSLLNSSIDLKRLTQDLIDVLKGGMLKDQKHLDESLKRLSKYLKTLGY